jgi:hypothetical protein
MPRNLRVLLGKAAEEEIVAAAAVTVMIKSEIKAAVQTPKVPLTMSSNNKEIQVLPMKAATILALTTICSQQQEEKENKEEPDQLHHLLVQIHHRPQRVSKDQLRQNVQVRQDHRHLQEL